jgi:predicted ribosomally synthesized peptide with nif11-like leader
MKENVKKFLEALSKNPEMAREIRDSEDKETVIKVAKAHGFELTEADFIDTEDGRLSEDEMKAVAGGRHPRPWTRVAVDVSCLCIAQGSGVDAEGNPMDESVVKAADQIRKF